jgi:hypothetical protein
MPYIIKVGGTTCHVVAEHFDARETAAYEIERRTGADEDYEEMYSDAQNVSELGGTFGPLPDGSMLEVIPASWNWVIAVAEDAGIDTDLIHSDAPTGKGDLAILDAYNEVLP